MKLTYDPRINVAYIQFREGPAQVETLHLSDDFKVDVTADGTVYGIELLNAREQLSGPHGAVVEAVNEALDEHSELKLAL